ncbi:sensory box/GGDEF domain/EAL domain protein [Cellvibrio japonicus Ueda107]|uniref:cyclic-guanylate-specific phosphodiesterase n=2 Tax=Cellvibrio japonicus TaxID=155077 RepID=B3PCW8_CELJU|nr:sensory box/GGDEF domain/EAL domain protein [Cellvibrio japonicus Ueda107]QEI11914.1 EAL domain-containing protein [Cellvibrio japonicus]QEI15488.1 EAL domain-containing protein [Cellvibrio japonicus]QEI19067.1 EAL domain-containing protein [Cellvibrio japonicus]
MRPSNSPGSPAEPSGVFAILGTSEIAAWNMDVTAEEIHFSSDFCRLFPDWVDSTVSLAQLLQHLPAADRYFFLTAFNSDSQDQDCMQLRSCELRLHSAQGDKRLRFVGRLQPGNIRRYQGVVFSATHWLAEPGVDYSTQLLSALMADSPIPSLITDAHGVIVYLNSACEQILMLSPRQIKAALGRYSLLRDKQLQQTPEFQQQLAEVYGQGNATAFELHYPLSGIHRYRLDNEHTLYLDASFLPIKNKQGKLERVLVQLQDLSRELYARAALQESETSYKAFITNSSEAIWCYDMQPRVDTGLPIAEQVEQIAASAHLVEANRVLLNMLGVETLDDVLGQPLSESGSTNYLFDLDTFIANGYQMVDHDITRQDERGKKFYFQISCTGIIEDGYLRRIWGTTKDVTTRKRYEDKLRHQSLHDSLTGLPNREKLYQDMASCFEQRTAEQISALMLIDLDRFKEINDTLGHNVGDRLLQMIGPRLAAEMAEVPGTVARLGGDEFAVFLPRIRSTHQAVVFGHRILDALAQEYDLEVFCTQMSASIGIAIAPYQAQDHHALMRYADIAMYYAKSQMLGLSIYSPDYDPHSPKRLAMMSELGRAIRENQLCLYYQPKVVLDECRCYGFEALIRWIHPELGFVPPDDFIPIAEFTSLIHPLTAWVLENSIEQCRHWQLQGLNLSVAVNLSARNLMDENIPKLVERLLNKYQLPAARLELEITESSIMSDPNRALRILQHLHELGVHLSIDDFGTGYSSLAYLKRLPVQTLKIDNSFVRNMLGDLQDELIVNSTIHLAHNLGLTVVAEGVENEELMKRLHDMGCDEVQGYFIGRPMTVNNADQWLVESGWIKQLEGP